MEEAEIIKAITFLQKYGCHKVMCEDCPLYGNKNDSQDKLCVSLSRINAEYYRKEGLD